MAEFDVNSRHRASGDQYFDQQAEEMLLDEERNSLMALDSHKLDGEEARKELRQLLNWYYHERDKQSANRLEQALDCDFYDNLQWDPDDIAELHSRGQMPLVYNEVAPMVDWIIGTERRTRVDWKVLPRTEDDVQAADVKTKVMKYVSDVNRTSFNRSRAFADAVKAGVGWVDDGVRDDPTTDILYDRYEDWRNVLWDSSSYEHDLSDARYIFRWRWVDEDIACMMFPDRADKIKMAVRDQQHHLHDEETDTWYGPHDQMHSGHNNDTGRSGTLRGIGSSFAADAKRARVKLIECQYRKPVKAKVVGSGPMKGAFFDERDAGLMASLQQNGGWIVDKIMMRVHVAVFTESDMLAMGPSIFRHNRFSLTPVWCYRRSRDRLPYGVIRRVRDIQQDLNKRASKALFMLNTNQIIADEGAVEDWSLTRDEVDRPDGVVVKAPGKDFQIRRDTDAATGQIQMMNLAAQSIQKSAGVSDENLGRRTNAVSGEAIKARQMQGSVVTTEPFDNLRLAVQVSGEKILSLVEQFYTEEKVIRLSGEKGALEWIKINVPEQQVDGSVRFINDITAAMADFVVSEQDYAGTLRQVMFESLNNMATRLPPEVSLRVMTIAMEYSDLPNKDQIADELRKLTGDRDPNKPMNPEEMAQMQQQMQAQAEAMEVQRQQAMLALQEQQAKVREINAKAAEIESRAQMAMMGGDNGQAAAMQDEMQRMVMQIRADADKQIDQLTQQLRKVQSDAANQTMRIKADADMKLQTARIDADAKVRVAEIQAANDAKLDAMMRRLEDMGRSVEDRVKSVQDEANKRIEVVKAEMSSAMEKEAPEPTPAPAPMPEAQPITINVQVDAKGAVKKSIDIKKDAKGNIVGAEVKEEGEGG